MYHDALLKISHIYIYFLFLIIEENSDHSHHWIDFDNLVFPHHEQAVEVDTKTRVILGILSWGHIAKMP